MTSTSPARSFAASDQRKYIPTELFFYSECLDETYKASQLQDLSEQTLQTLASELSQVIASIGAVRDDAEAKIRLGEPIDLNWLGRVRFRLNKVLNFRKLVLRELDIRAGMHGKKEAIAAIKREKASISVHQAHQEKMKRREFQKRKFFYGMVKEKLGEAWFDTMMSRAEDMAMSVLDEA